jgi:hypothetical protein
MVAANQCAKQVQTTTRNSNPNPDLLLPSFLAHKTCTCTYIFSPSFQIKLRAHRSPNIRYLIGAVPIFTSSRTFVNKNTQWLMLDADVVDSAVDVTEVAVVVLGEEVNEMRRRSGMPASFSANRQL